MPINTATGNSATISVAVPGASVTGDHAVLITSFVASSVLSSGPYASGWRYIAQTNTSTGSTGARIALWEKTLTADDLGTSPQVVLTQAGNWIAVIRTSSGMHALHPVTQTKFTLRLTMSAVITSTVTNPGSTTYSYQVTCVDDAGESPPSTAEVVTTGNATLSPLNTIAIKWQAITGADSYNIYRDSGSGFKLIGSADRTNVTGITSDYKHGFTDIGQAEGAQAPPASYPLNAIIKGSPVDDGWPLEAPMAGEELLAIFAYQAAVADPALTMSTPAGMTADAVVRAPANRLLLGVFSQVALPTGAVGTRLSSSSQSMNYASFGMLLRPAATNSSPVAKTGPSLSGFAAETMYLDGTRSTDPDGDDLTYAWSQINGPTAVLSDATSPTPSIVPQLGTAVFRLTVTDPTAAADTDEVSVEVAAAQLNEVLLSSGFFAV